MHVNETPKSYEIESLSTDVKTYSEMDSFRIDSNVLEQLKANLKTLEDLHMKLHFMLNEVRGIIQK